MMKVTLKRVVSLIPHNMRRGALGVIVATIIIALLNFIGVVVLISILLLVLDEGAVFNNTVVASIYDALGFTSQNSFVVFICIAVLVIIALKSILTLLVANSVRKYQLSLFRYYSALMFDTYLSKGLLFIHSNHTSKLINDINGVCLRFTDGVVGVLFNMASEIILLLLIGCFLTIYNPMIALLAVAVFMPLALVYSRVFRRRMVENGKEENRLFVEQNKTIHETFRGYTDIEINNAEGFISDKFRTGLKKLSDYRRKAWLVRLASGSVIEFSLILGVVAMIIAGLIMGETMSALKISLGVFAIAAYKIVPSANKIINYWVDYKRNIFSVETIYDALTQSNNNISKSEDITSLDFEKEIVVEDISFSYNGESDVIRDFSLNIRKGEKIGIRGSSGAGKTTLLNILCGFFEPQSGRVLIDGVELMPENKRAWQSNLAYVSQNVFIPDVTIAENIAFGVDRADVDEEKLWRAIKTASLDSFVNSLPAGVDTVTGEGGCRLSGGQRQRIGIARALYKEASVLMFDEATSSLDNKTEKEIVDAIESLSAQQSGLTILIISHNERTLAFCDRLIDIMPNLCE